MSSTFVVCKLIRTLGVASPKAGYISGTVVTIDGGIAARGSVI